jgi:hypothetical protein
LDIKHKKISIYYIDMSVYEPPLKDVSIFDKNNFISKSTLLTQNNSPFIQFPKAQGDVILRNVEANNIQVDGDVLMNSLRTPDKIVNSWVSRTIPIVANINLRDITYSPQLGIFCAVNDFNGSTTDRFLTSTDGINWSIQTATSLRWSSITWAAELGLFCAVSVTGGATNRVITSPNGTTWTIQTSASNNSWRSVVWAAEANNGNGLFCAVSDSGSGNQVMTSPNGTTWTERVTPTPTINWRAVTWGAECPNGSGGFGLFCAVADSVFGQVMTSPDGVNWTLQSAPIDINWFNITWSPKLKIFCAVARAGTSRIMTSPNGVNWTLQTSPINRTWRKITWSNELGIFYVVGNSNEAIYSTNGVQWTANTNNLPFNEDYLGLTWSPELYMFVAVTFQGNVITTREASKPLLSNTSKQVESTAQALTIMSPLSGTTSNIQNQLTATPNVFENDGVPTKVIGAKILFGTITTTSSGTVASVTFDPPFNNTPKVYASVLNIIKRVPLITNVTATGFDIDSIDNSGARTSRPYNWIAIST